MRLLAVTFHQNYFINAGKMVFSPTKLMRTFHLGRS